MNRRRFVGTLAIGGVVGTAGCMGRVTDHEAVPAAVDRDAAGEAGYEYRGTEPMVERRDAGPVTVEATSYLSEYTRSIDLPGFGAVDAAVFALVSTPRISVAGQEFNPVADWSQREIAERIQSQYDAVSVGDSLGGRAVDLLDGSADVETFDGEASLAGQGSLDVLLDVGKTDHESDHLVVVGVYPRDLVDSPADLGSGADFGGTSEGERIDAMIENVRHDGEGVEIDDAG